MQPPNPIEMQSKKSPEKLLLLHPTDLDLETLRSKEEAEAEAISLSGTKTSNDQLLVLINQGVISSWRGSGFVALENDIMGGRGRSGC